MRSRVKCTLRTVESLTTNSKEVHVNLNEEEPEESIPLEHNFSSQTPHCTEKRILSLFWRCGGQAGTRTSLGLERLATSKEDRS